ncbi:hypothetical protein OHC33_002714 [Knufia fluminis]|uniref:C2H2-type domain-containing protein n=1 Tax=Knufia fluminis TaxID=191047 RepID=A0AAN8FD56_9EURO|nr:hypothetical protein OHC33_002714 [Knufia fluminis]
MDVQQNTRERVFSILNDNDCPSFVHRQKQSSPSPPPQKLPSISSLTSFSPRLTRPNLFRLPQFQRTQSGSSAGSPPLLRHSSSSSENSSTSMESTPSPSTPAYNYNDNTMVSYDSLLRQDPTLSFLPSPTGITPFLDQSLMIAPVPQDAVYPSKAPPALAPGPYPVLPPTGDIAQMPTPSMSVNTSDCSTLTTGSQPQPAPANNTGNSTTGKKNKYPCPYAQSHNCSATFTTSGHAARHGKKHTGEKGVHCPICDKAFTRKDNMKQHERTHKNRAENAGEKKSKAQTTRDANKVKETEDQEPATAAQRPSPTHMRTQSSGLSDPSDITLAPNPVDTPGDMSFFPDPNPQIVLPCDTAALGATQNPASLYPPLGDEMLAAAMAPNEKLEVSVPQPPTLVRGFSDLDTLAQAAESFDPYFQQGQF